MTSSNHVDRVRTNVAYIAAFPDCIVAIALALGCYVRYNVYEKHVIAVVAAGAATLVGSNLLLKYYFGVRFSTALYNLWTGCLLGVLAMYDISSLLDNKSSSLEDIVNVMLMAALVTDILVVGIQRCCLRVPNVHLGTQSQICLLIGAATSCLLITAANPAPLLCLLLALLCCVIALHVRSHVAVVALVLLVVFIEPFVLHKMQLSVNPYALFLFASRVTCVPLVDMIVGVSGRLDVWMPFMNATRCTHHAILAVATAVQLAFLYTHSTSISSHKEWFIVVPMFATSTVVWSICHASMMLVYTSLTGRLRTASRSSPLGTANAMKQTLAATGLRYFALLAHGLVVLCCVFTIVLSLLCYTTPSMYTMSLAVAAICVDVCMLQLLAELSTQLGGTACGYAMVTPNVPTRTDGLVTLMPEGVVESHNDRSTRQLQSMITFFTQHIITNYGADWSMQGVSQKECEEKLSNFFHQSTHEGPRYDTYIIYFSGPTLANGDWALTDGGSMSMTSLLGIWDDANTSASSRLLIVADCVHGHQWLTHIWRDTKRYVAMQTCELSSKAADDSIDSSAQFTQLFTQMSSGAPVDTHHCTFRPRYAVSRPWPKFDMHSPSHSDVCTYWNAQMPSCCLRPVLLLLSMQPLMPTQWWHWAKSTVLRCRLRISPPSMLDTGHGFWLVAK